MKRLSLETTAHLVAGLALLSLLAAEERERLIVPVCVAAALILAKLEPRFKLSEPLWRAASLAALGLFVVEVWVLGQSALFATVHLLIYLLVNKAFHLDTLGDHGQILFVSFLVLLGTTVLAVEIVVAVLLGLFMAAAVAHLHALALVRAAAPSSGPSPGVPIGRGLRLAALVAAGGMVVFALVPRVGAGTVEVGRGMAQHVTGFSAELDLDDIGRIKTSTSMVMRVRWLDGPLPDERLFLRGVAFSSWTGKRWRREPSPRPLAAKSFAVFAVPPPPVGPVTRFEINLEPTLTSVVFAPARATEITLKNDHGQIYQDSAGALAFDLVPRRRALYVTTSQLRPSRRGRPKLFPGEAEAASFVELPPVDPRILRLARQLARDSKDPREIASRIERHLRANYAYSLDLSQGLGDDPLAGFLFEARQGHCELFASAMAVMLRTLGIPARVVNGFVASADNSIGDYYLVRARDAHSWVEAWMGDAGWTVYDPTPSQPGFGGAGLYNRLLAAWDRWVISYSMEDQRAAWNAFLAGGGAILDWLSAGLARGPWLGGAALMALAGLVALLAWAMRRRRRARTAESADGVVLAYADMVRVLARHGVPKPPAATPDEFAASVAGDFPEVAAITALYVQSRFAARPLAAAAGALLGESFAALKRRLRHTSARPSA